MSKSKIRRKGGTPMSPVEGPTAGPGTPSQIITPGAAKADDAARQHMAMLRNNPLWPILEQTVKDTNQLKTDLKNLVNKHNMMGAMLNSFMDYHNERGLFDQEQELEEGQHSYNQHLQNHVELMQFLPMLMERVNMGDLPMLDAIEEVREFNKMPSRIKKVRGDQFDLHIWLSANPANLSEEEQGELATEFGLLMLDEPEEIPEGMATTPDGEPVSAKVEMKIVQDAAQPEGEDGDGDTAPAS